MKKKVNDPMYKVVVKIKNSKEIINSEKNSRLKKNTITWSSDDIPEDGNMYEFKHVGPLYRYHDNAEDMNEKTCWCSIFGKGSKSLY